MTIPSQLHLIFQLDTLRKKIIATQDRESVLALATAAVDLALPVPIDPAFQYKIIGKERTLNMLRQEIRLYEKGNTEPEIISFQLSSSILMLMLQFIEGTLQVPYDISKKNEDEKAA